MNCSACCSRSFLLNKAPQIGRGVAIGIALSILGIGAGYFLGNYLNWNLQSSLLLGGGIAVVGVGIEVALFIILGQKKLPATIPVVLEETEIASSPISIEKLEKKGDAFGRTIMKIHEGDKTYYAKFSFPNKKIADVSYHFAGARHPLNDILAYEIAKFINCECIPQTWFFKDQADFKKSEEFSPEFKKAFCAEPDFKRNTRPFIIQLGVSSSMPHFGDNIISKAYSEKCNNYIAKVELETISAQEVLLLIALLGNFDAGVQNCLVDNNKKLKLIDNDVIGCRLNVNNKIACWLWTHKVINIDFDEVLKKKFQNIDAKALEEFLRSLQSHFAKNGMKMCENFIPNILGNLVQLQEALNVSKHPKEFFYNWNLKNIKKPYRRD